MDVYVLKEGRRTGPYLPFKLRELLEDGEISPADQGWLEGMESWAPLESIEALAGWMPRKPGAPPPLPSARDWPQNNPAPSPRSNGAVGWPRFLRAFRRWIARLTDGTLWYALVWLIGVKAGWLDVWAWMPDLGGVLICLLPPLLWLPVEATLIHFLGATPGKWFMGLRVTDDLGQKLPWLTAMKRTALVHVTGNGLGLPASWLFPVLQWSMSWMFFRRTETTLWDRVSHSQVNYLPVPPLGVITVVLTVVGWLTVYSCILLQAPIPPNLPDAFRTMVEEKRRQFYEVQKKIEQEQQELNRGPSAAPQSQPPASESAPALEPGNPPKEQKPPTPAPPAPPDPKSVVAML